MNVMQTTALVNVLMLRDASTWMVHFVANVRPDSTLAKTNLPASIFMNATSTTEDALTIVPNNQDWLVTVLANCLCTEVELLVKPIERKLFMQLSRRVQTWSR